MGDVDPVLDPEDIKTILRIIEWYEDDEVCDSPIWWSNRALTRPR